MTVADDEPSIARSQLRRTIPSKIPSDSKSHDKLRCSPRRHRSSSLGNCCEKSVSKGLCSIFYIESAKSSEVLGNCSRLSIYTRRHRNPQSSKQSVTVIEQVNRYYQTAVDYRIYRLFYSSQQYDSDVARRIANMARRLEMQLKSQMIVVSGPISIFSFLPTFHMPCDTHGIHAQRCAYSTF